MLGTEKGASACVCVCVRSFKKCFGDCVVIIKYLSNLFWCIQNNI